MPPELAMHPEQRAALEQINAKLKSDLRSDTPRLLSPRGDRVYINDERARALGYKWIEYRINPAHKREFIVRLRIGNFTFTCKLNAEKQVVMFSQEERALVVGIEQFSEHMILSHLHAVLCGEGLRRAQEQATEGTARGPLGGGRPAHRRILPHNHKPTMQQIEYIFNTYEISIPALNAKRQAEGESGMVTYVSHVDPTEDISELPPVDLKGPNTLTELSALLANNNQPSNT